MLPIIEISPCHALGLRGYCFWQRNKFWSLRLISTSCVFFALPMFPPMAQTSGSIYTSIQGRHKPWLGSIAMWIEALTSYKISLSKRGVGLSGTIRKAWEKKMDSQSQLKAFVKNCSYQLARNMTVADSWGRGPGLERRTEKWLPCSGGSQ